LNTLGLLILISPGVSGIFETSIPVSGQTNLTLKNRKKKTNKKKL